MTCLLATHWVHDLDPVILHLGGAFAIRWYGLAYLAGFVGAYLIMRRAHRVGRSPLAPAQLETLFTALFIGVLLGGRLGYMLLYDFPALAANPLRLFRIWEGGMASHGGFVGVTCAVLWSARALRVSCWTIADLVALTAPLGLFFGRLANFVNGELWGKVSEVPWAVVFPQSAPAGTPVAWIAPRHPSQLYEAALEGLLLLGVMQWIYWRRDPAKAVPGQLAGLFFVLYSLVRIGGETFREPDASLILGLSRGTFYSILTLVAGMGMLLWRRGGPDGKCEK